MKSKKTFLILLPLIFLLLLLNTFAVGNSFDVHAESNSKVIAYEKQNIMDDLNDATINGKKFDIKDYPINYNKETTVLSFVEFCYSFDAKRLNDYGLYVYIYNPRRYDYSKYSVLDKIQFRAGSQSNFIKYRLTFLNQSGGDYEGVFVKFRVELNPEQRENILKALDANERTYEVSGVELYESGSNATEYKCARVFTYTGFALGYGVSVTGSTLKATEQEFQTISLDTKTTYYRYPKDARNFTQLNSVYFAVDNDYTERFGTLYKIWAEYWQYQLTPIIVTDNDDLYQNILNDTYDLEAAEQDSVYKLYAYSERRYTSSRDTIYCDYVYGRGINWINFLGLLDIEEKENCIKQTKRPLIYKTSETPAEATIPREDLDRIINEQLQNYGEGFTYTGGKGYTAIDISADDLFDIPGTNYGNAFLNWFAAMCNKNLPDLKNVKPIYKVTISDLAKDDASLRNDLLIASEDVAAFRTYCKKQMAENRSVWLFRYDTNDYKELDAIAIKNGVTAAWDNIDNQRVRFQTIDRNFDIIQLGFGSAKELVIIPVVSTPKDNVGASQGSEEIFDETQEGEKPGTGGGIFGNLSPEKKVTLNWVLLGLAIVAITLIIIFIKPICLGLWWLICLPFRAIKNAINRRRTAKVKSNNNYKKPKYKTTTRKRN